MKTSIKHDIKKQIQIIFRYVRIDIPKTSARLELCEVEVFEGMLFVSCLKVCYLYRV
jgi:hypothetical protein